MSTSPTPLDHLPGALIDASPPAPPRRVDAHDAAVVALGRERERLERVVAELRAIGLDQQSAEEDLGEIASVSQHPADVASETFEREVELGLLDDFRDALAEVEAALARVATRRYGRCERCAASIGSERLVAVPATRWCLPCAEAVEREARWRTPGRPRMRAISEEFLARDDEPDTAESDVDRPSEEAALSVRELLAAD